MFKSVIKPLPFCYAFTAGAVTAGATSNPSFNISNDSDFILTEIRGSIVKAAAFDGSVLIQIKTADGTLFSNAGIDALSFVSSNQNPLAGTPIYFPSIRIPRNSTIEISITNNNAANLVSFQVQLWGYKPNE